MAQAKREERISSIDEMMREIFGKWLRPDTPPSGDLNITMGQMHCQHAIAQLGSPTMSQLAERLGLHPSTVTVLVDGLVAHGLVSRRGDSQDRRIVRVKETAKGRRNRERHRARMRARVTEILSSLSDEELTMLHGSLEALRRAARQYAEAREKR